MGGGEGGGEVKFRMAHQRMTDMTCVRRSGNATRVAGDKLAIIAKR